MNIANFVATYWSDILLVLFASVTLILAIYKGNKQIVFKMLDALVTEAERLYGQGTGSLKLAKVIEWVYPKLPTIIKIFATEDRLTKWVEQALAAAKVKWDTNEKIQSYISGEKS